MSGVSKKQKTMTQSELFWRPGNVNDNEFAYRKFRQPYTIRELEYMHVLCEILNKKQWWVKMNNPKVLTKWREEITAFGKPARGLDGKKEVTNDSEQEAADEGKQEGASEDENRDGLEEESNDASTQLFQSWNGFTEKEFNLLKEELQAVAEMYELTNETSNQILPMTSHGVFISDTVIPVHLLQSIQELTTPLETAAIKRKDYHPNSNNQVLDIVHPSLYCCVYGTTFFSRNPNTRASDEIITWNGEKPYGKDISGNFQWLPSSISVDSKGKVTFRSYINNIHRGDNKELYTAIEDVLTKMTPMFEKCLGSKDHEPQHRIDVDYMSLQESHEDYERREFIKRKKGPDADITADYPDLDFEGSDYEEMVD